MTLNPDDPTLMLPGGGLGASGETSGPSIVDQKIVEAAIRRGLISAVQATSVLESLSGSASSESLPAGQWLSESHPSGALPALVARGLVSQKVATELEDEVKNDFVPGYSLLGELGRGGMGVVYKAKHKRLDRVVALKVVNPGSSADPAYLRRFQQEALALAKLNHPNIVQVYDYGETAQKVYLALEFVEGKDALRELRDGGGRMSEAQALRLVRDSALGLGHAHAAGIIHRDVKPANLMLVARAKPGPDDRWVAKVTDLGLARQASKEQHASVSTKAGTILGSPAYMAPEQADGEAADYRSDIYALGATLYHLVTGKPPYDADSAIKVIVKKQTERLDDPRALVPGLSDALVRFLDRCLARPPEERYQTYEALVEDVERVLRGEDPQTPPVPEGVSSLRLGPLRPPTRRVAPGAPGGSSKAAALVVAGAVVLSGAGSIVLAVRRLQGDATTTTTTTDAGTGTSASAAARATATLEALAALSPADVLEPTRLREVVAQVRAVPEAERTNVSLRLASVVGKALDAVADERAAALEATLARADYAGLVAGVARALEPYLVLSREPPARLRVLEEVAKKAGGEEGEAERAAWSAAQEARSPVAVLTALAGFAERFPWSPALEQAKVKWAEANVQAPEVRLEPRPAEARVTLDDAQLPPGVWTGRLLLGKHTITAEADDHFVLERVVDVKGPLSLTLRLNPKPARPLVEDPERGSPAWFPRRALLDQWVISGEWRSVVDASALEGEGKPDGSWATANRDLAAVLKQVRIGAGPWRLVWECTPPLEGAAELRLAGEEGTARAVVVGVTRDEVYLGVRDGDALEVLATFVLPSDGTAYLSADWDGSVVLLQHKRDLVGSVAPGWKAGPPCIQAAVRGKGPAAFRSLELRALVPSGTR